MITKTELEAIVFDDLKKVFKTEIIFKYGEFDIMLQKVLLEQSLKFSDPSTFNDPFDCNERLLQLAHDSQLIKETLSSLFPQYKLSQKQELLRKLHDPKTIQNIIKNKRKEYKIACFSEINNETLMWSHYADKHSGICVGFNFPYLYKDHFILCPVKYLKEIKPVDGAGDLIRVILYWLTTKSIRWQYEYEIRAISNSKTSDDFEYLHYDGSFVKEIIFGCNVPKNKVNNTIEQLKNSKLNYREIVIKQMEIDDNTFLLKENIIKSCA